MDRLSPCTSTYGFLRHSTMPLTLSFAPPPQIPPGSTVPCYPTYPHVQPDPIVPQALPDPIIPPHSPLSPTLPPQCPMNSLYPAQTCVHYALTFLTSHHSPHTSPVPLNIQTSLQSLTDTGTTSPTIPFVPTPPHTHCRAQAPHHTPQYHLSLTPNSHNVLPMCCPGCTDSASHLLCHLLQ